MDEPTLTEDDKTHPPAAVAARITRGAGPLVAVALHHGHQLRPEVAERLALDEAARLREEDPLTGVWTHAAPTRIIVETSRFEVDLNRPRDRAVYRCADDAWGLNLWTSGPEPALVERSLAAYDRFYADVGEIFDSIRAAHGRFVVLDIHSYNHRRGGPGAPPEPAEANPQINLGTGSMNRPAWANVVDGFIDDLRGFPFPGGALDVRENVRFRGGRFARWVHETYPDAGCVLAVEVKKFFMDEWTGRPDPSMVEAIGEALASAAAGLPARLEADDA